MNRRRAALIAALSALLMSSRPVQAVKLDGLTVIDRDYLAVAFLEGEVVFRDDGAGPAAFGGADAHEIANAVETYGPLDTAAAAAVTNWHIVSADDPAYAGRGKAPLQ